MAMREATVVSERRACQLVGLSRTVLHYESKVQPENEQLKARLVELAGERRRFGSLWSAERACGPITNGFIGSTAMPAFPFVAGSAGTVLLWSGRNWNARADRTKSGRWISSVMPWPMAVGSRC